MHRMDQKRVRLMEYKKSGMVVSLPEQHLEHALQCPVYLNTVYLIQSIVYSTLCILLHKQAIKNHAICNGMQELPGQIKQIL